MTDFYAESQSYRRGFVEGQTIGVPDAYLLLSGAVDVAEYQRGFSDGFKLFNEATNDRQSEDC